MLKLFWRQQAFQGQTLNIIDQQSFQKLTQTGNIPAKESIVDNPIFNINQSIVEQPKSQYLYQEPILRTGLSQQSKDKKYKVTILNKNMNELIFTKSKSKGVQVARKVIKVNNQFQIELYPQTLELLYLNRELIQRKIQLINQNQQKKTQLITQVPKLLITFSQAQTVFDLKFKIKKILQNISPKFQDIRIYCYEKSLFQLVNLNRYLEYYLFKDDIRYCANQNLHKFYKSINNRAEDNFLVQFFPGKMLTDQPRKYFKENAIRMLVVEALVSNKSIFPEQPFFSVSKNCHFCTIKMHLYRRFECQICKNVLMFCSRVCQYQSLLIHACIQAKHRIVSLYGSSLVYESSKNNSIIGQRYDQNIKKNQNKAKNKISYKSIKKSDRDDTRLKLRFRRGIQNLGNTCYLNSVLQMLACTSLPQILLKQNYLKTSKLAQAYTKFTKILQPTKQIQLQYVPNADIQNLKNVIDQTMPRFSGYDQQDAHEFITFFLEQLHNQLNKPKITKNIKSMSHISIREIDQESATQEQMGRHQWMKFIQRGNSPIINLFYGQIQSQIKCLQCLNVSKQFNPFNTLELSIFSTYQQFSITLYYEYYRFTNETVMITVLCKNTSLQDFLTQVQLKIGSKHNKDKRNLKPFLLGCQQTFQYCPQTLEVKDLSNLIDPENNLQRKLFIFQPPFQSNVYIPFKFILTSKKSFAFKRPLFFNKSKSNISNSMLYEAVIDYFVCLFNLQDQRKGLQISKIKYKVQNYFILYLQKCTIPSQNSNKVSQYQGRILQVNNSICQQLHSKECQVWVELQKFYQTKDKTEIAFYNIITSKINSYFATDISEKDKLHIDDQYLRLEECIEQQFSKKQYLNLDNRVFCLNCNQKRDTQKTTYLYKAPRYLIIHLKRFKSAIRGQAYDKNITKIVTPTVLDLKDILKNPFLPEQYYKDMTVSQKNLYNIDNITTETFESQRYNLKAVILHEGSIQKGHYYAYCQSGGHWWNFDDKQVSKINISQQLNISLKMQRIYILMYERIKQ